MCREGIFPKKKDAICFYLFLQQGFQYSVQLDLQYRVKNIIQYSLQYYVHYILQYSVKQKIPKAGRKLFFEPWHPCT